MSKYGFIGNILTRFFGKNTLDRVTGSDKTLKEYIDLANSDSMDSKLDNVIPNSEYGNPITELFRSLSSYLNSKTGSHLTGAQQEQNVFNAEQAAIERGWSERMSNTAYQRSVTDMQTAGLNPALMYGSAGVSAAPSGAVAGGSSPAAPAFSLMSMLMEYNLKNRELDIEQQNANSTEKGVDAEVRNTEVNTSWIDILNQAQLDSMNARLEMTKAETDNIREHKHEILENVKLLIAQTQSEEVRKLYLDAERNLADMSAKEIGSLLPLRAAYIQAQTSTEKAQAGLILVNKAIQQGLLDEGIVFAQLDEIASRISANESGARRDNALAQYQEFHNACKNGSMFHIDLTDKDSGFIKGVEDYINAVGAEGVFGAVGALIENGIGKVAGLGALATRKFYPTKFSMPNGEVGSYWKIR